MADLITCSRRVRDLSATCIFLGYSVALQLRLFVFTIVTIDYSIVEFYFIVGEFPVLRLCFYVDVGYFWNVPPAIHGVMMSVWFLDYSWMLGATSLEDSLCLWSLCLY